MEEKIYPFTSLGEMIEKRSEEMSEKEILVYYDENYTYKQFNENTNRLANFLKDTGFRKGNVLATYTFNSPQMLFSFFAVHKLGGAVTPINTGWKGEEVIHQINHSDATHLLIHSEFLPIIEEVKDRLTGLKEIIVIGENYEKKYLSYEKEIEKYSPERNFEIAAGLEDIAFLYYTSGTTGKPKGVPLLHRNIMSYWAAGARAPGMGGGPVLKDATLTFLIILPLFHVNAMMTSMNCLYGGIKICLRKKFSAREFWEVVEKYKVNIVSAVPAVYSILLKDEENYKKYNRSSLFLCITGAAEISPETIKKFEEKFGVMVYEGYGLTEGTVASTMNPLGQRKIGSIGKPLPGQTVAIMDDRGNLLGPGEIGEIVVKGDNVMKGYYKDEEATRETIDSEGWLHTGDMGYYDEEGYFYIVGRKKDMIIRGGENIYPKEIENTLYEHPNIMESAVVPVPDEVMGEEVGAYIVPRPGSSLTEEEVIQFCKSRLADYKVPRYIKFVDELPKSHMGKILKKELKERAKTDFLKK